MMLLINKTAGSTWKDKNLLYLQKKFEHEYTNDKNYYYTGEYRGDALHIAYAT